MEHNKTASNQSTPHHGTQQDRLQSIHARRGLIENNEAGCVKTDYTLPPSPSLSLSLAHTTRACAHAHARTRTPRHTPLPTPPPSCTDGSRPSERRSINRIATWHSPHAHMAFATPSDHRFLLVLRPRGSAAQEAHATNPQGHRRYM